MLLEFAWLKRALDCACCSVPYLLACLFTTNRHDSVPARLVAASGDERAQSRQLRRAHHLLSRGKQNAASAIRMRCSDCWNCAAFISFDCRSSIVFDAHRSLRCQQDTQLVSLAHPSLFEVNDSAAEAKTKASVATLPSTCVQPNALQMQVLPCTPESVLVACRMRKSVRCWRSTRRTERNTSPTNNGARVFIHCYAIASSKQLTSLLF